MQFAFASKPVFVYNVCYLHRSSSCRHFIQAKNMKPTTHLVLTISFRLSLILRNYAYHLMGKQWGTDIKLSYVANFSCILLQNVPYQVTSLYIERKFNTSHIGIINNWPIKLRNKIFLSEIKSFLEDSTSWLSLFSLTMAYNPEICLANFQPVRLVILGECECLFPMGEFL